MWKQNGKKRPRNFRPYHTLDILPKWFPIKKRNKNFPPLSLYLRLTKIHSKVWIANGAIWEKSKDRHKKSKHYLVKKWRRKKNIVSCAKSFSKKKTWCRQNPTKKFPFNDFKTVWKVFSSAIFSGSGYSKSHATSVKYLPSVICQVVVHVTWKNLAFFLTFWPF